MTTHDPLKVMEDLRNHLATHDRRLSFLFGAGTSCAVNVAPPPPPGERPGYWPLIPGIAELTAACRKAVAAMGTEEAVAWDRLVTECEASGLPANVERILTKVRVKMDAVGKGESLLGLDANSLAAVEKVIRGAIATAVNPDVASIPEHTAHDAFGLWVKRAKRTVPLEIFTTNYDILLEKAFESARVPVYDAFVGCHQPFFYPECLEDDAQLPGPSWVRLWKLHGSVNWAIADYPSGKRIVRTHPMNNGEVILPSNRKYDESRKQPYVSYMDRLSRVINAEYALLVTCGYSFGDEHINAILFGALDNRMTANVIALQYQCLREEDELVRSALRRSNLTVIGPNGGVISGVWGSWRLSRPVDPRTAAFMDDGFDSNAVPPDAAEKPLDAENLRGTMRLGDFNWFCRFLAAMGWQQAGG